MRIRTPDTPEQTYLKALFRRCYGLMPYNLTEQSPRKKKKIIKKPKSAG